MNRRIYSLDILRCITMLIVLNQHFLGTFWKELEESTYPISFLWNGHFAVAVFFVLSGFGMAYGRLTKTPQKNALGLMKSIFKRYSRFTVSILIVCFLIFLINKFGIFTSVRNGFCGDVSGIQLERIGDWTSVLEDGFWKILFMGETRYNMVLWTMKYEWYASLYLIILFYFICDKGRMIRYGMYILSGCIALLFDPTYCTFIVGVVLADILVSIERKEGSGLKRKILGYILCVCGCVLGSYPSYGQASWWDVFLPNFRVIMQAMHVIAAALAVFGVILLDKENKKCSNWLVSVSAATYEMYLVHVMVIYTMGIWIYKRVSSWNVFYVEIVVCYIGVLITTVTMGLLINKCCRFTNRRKDI